MDLAKFVAKRDEILTSLDETRIRAYIAEYDIPIPTDGALFWPSVHKAITAAKTIPIDVRKKSKEWLTEHGFRSMDDGDL